MKERKFNKKLFMIAVMFLLVTALTFADDTNDLGVGAVVNNIVNFFGSGWVKGIACIALIAEAIGLIFAGGQNPQVFKKFLPLIAGTIIFMCAGKICSLIFSANTQSFSSDLTKTVSYVQTISEEEIC